MAWVAELLLRLDDMGPWSPVLFFALYVVASVTLAPAFLLTFAAGAVFGLTRGTLVAFVGSVLGAVATFAVGSSLARTRLFGWLYRDSRVAAVRGAVAQQSVWIMFLLRLSPIVPFVLLNYALSLSGVRFRDFLVASVGMLPTIIVYVYYGKVVGDVAKLAAGVAPPRGPAYWALVIVGLITTVFATRSITRAARRAMEQ
jgi:uncharacterized membrane protein YdjX (TVP38/TMEM64 family)